MVKRKAEPKSKAGSRKPKSKDEAPARKSHIQLGLSEESDVGLDTLESEDKLDELDDLGDLDELDSLDSLDEFDEESEQQQTKRPKHSADDDKGEHETPKNEKQGASNKSSDEMEHDQIKIALKKATERKKKKEERRQRKLEKPLGSEIAEIKKLWEQFRVKRVSAAERKKLIARIFDVVCEHIAALVLRHDASRVVQSLFKYASNEQRAKMTDALKGMYQKLGENSYGKFLLVKMLHYGNKDVRMQIFDELSGHFKNLMQNREGAYVVEDLFRDYSTPQQRLQILRGLYDPQASILKTGSQKAKSFAEVLVEAPDRKPFLLSNLEKIIRTSVQKGLVGFEVVHALMLIFVQNMAASSAEKENFIDFITEHFAEIVHTKDGSHVGCLIVAVSSAKERKKLIKAVRPFADKLMRDQYANEVLSAFFLCVDDTVLVSKSFGPTLDEAPLEIMTHKYARLPFLMLFAGVTKKFLNLPTIAVLEEVNGLKSSTSKKDDDVRRRELIKSFTPTLYKLVVKHAGDLARNPFGLQSLCQILVHGSHSEEEGSRDKAVRAAAAVFGGSLSATKDHPLTNVSASRAARILISDCPGFAEELLGEILDHVVEWSCGAGAFVVAGLLAHLEDADAAPLRKTLRKHRKIIEQSESKGVQFIIEQL